MPTEQSPGLSTLEDEARSGEGGGFVPNSGAESAGPRACSDT